MIMIGENTGVAPCPLEGVINDAVSVVEELDDLELKIGTEGAVITAMTECAIHCASRGECSANLPEIEVYVGMFSVVANLGKDCSVLQGELS